jgi:large subunit ribosomal protein L23
MAIFSKKPEAQDDKVQYKADDKSSATVANVPDLKIPTILIQPRISEKAGAMAQMNKYVFLVAKDANKVEVKKAVEAAYKVKVTQVNVINNHGKKRNFGRTKGVTADFKKAIVTLKAGDKIEGLTDVV